MVTIDFTNHYSEALEMLTQWNANQTLMIRGLSTQTTPVIAFSNRASQTAVAVQARTVTGGYVCDIPNGLLTKPYTIYVDVRVSDGTGIKSIERGRIRVRPTSKPDDYEYVENITLVDITSFIADIDTVKSEFNSIKSMVGGPSTAGTKAAMTDTSKVYVYTGSETGMVNGNWYYHDGTNWVSGGVYNAIAVDTDKTLSVDDMAADAAAAGSIIEVGSTQPSSEANKLWIDPSADEIEIPEMSDLKIVEDKVDDLKSDIKQIGNELDLTVDSCVLSNGFVTNPSDSRCVSTDAIAVAYNVVVKCVIKKQPSENEYYTFAYGAYNDNGRIYGDNTLKESNNSVVVRNDNVKYVRFSIAKYNSDGNIVPIRIADFADNDVYAVVIPINGMYANIAKDHDIVESINKAILTPNIFNPETALNGYIGVNGVEYASETYMHTQRIQVNSGETYYIKPRARFLTAYNNANTAISASGLSSEFTSYTVPDGITEICISFWSEDVQMLMISKYDLEYIPFAEPYINREYLPELSTLQYLSQYDKQNYYKEKGDLSTDQYLLIDKFLSVKKNVVIAFSGNVNSEFTGVDIGFTSDISTTDLRHFQITPTELKRMTASPATQNHGISISGNLSITFELLFDEKLKITISSGGTSASFTYVWVAGYEKPYVKALSSMTDCVLSYTCKDLSKETAIFGDSYLSYGQNRWTYYLIDNNQIDNVLINAYAGEKSAQALVNFQNIMPISNNKVVIWALGMNDGDSSSSINTSWKTCVETVMNYCAEHGLKLILATIPNNPNVNNEYKNAYVRNSGYDYIDFAKAVGSDLTNSWYSGLLSNDNTHPTPAGAVVLYNRAIADCPALQIR